MRCRRRARSAAETRIGRRSDGVGDAADEERLDPVAGGVALHRDVGRPSRGLACRLEGLLHLLRPRRGRVIARNHEKILYMLVDRARFGRTDGSLVRFTIPIYNADVETAENTFEQFSQAITPLLTDYVPD